WLGRRLAIRFQILEASCTVLQDLSQTGPEQVREMIGDQATSELASILQTRSKATSQALQSLRACYPDYAAALEKRSLQQTAMRLELGHYQDMLANSLISKEVYDKLMEKMAERHQNLQQKLSLDLGLDAEKLIAKMPFFQDLGQNAQQDIAKLLKPRLALPGEMIFEKGGSPDAMYFISSGAVRVMLGEEVIILGSGDFFGEMALLTEQPRMASLYADGFCELLTLYTRDFKHLMEQDSSLRKVIEDVATERSRQNTSAE
ncbi:MAG: cyclic nucleotide-binding domain-containing protein, partial [Gammaproteobacteria bacterium]|nr:cyclic nucleotide-binding domain-containing protein [Gammaproteobacteria bacterium]